jgi:hypothetical protein
MQEIQDCDNKGGVEVRGNLKTALEKKKHDLTLRSPLIEGS